MTPIKTSPIGTGEDQIKEQLEPAGTPLVQVVTIRGPQRWRADVKGMDNDWILRTGRGPVAGDPRPAAVRMDQGGHRDFLTVVG